MSKDDGHFVATAGAEPTAGAGNFKIKASLMGVDLGWWKDKGSPEWWIVPTPNENEAIVWELVVVDGRTYFKKSTNNYLSYRSSKVIYQYGLKIRDWATAAAWQLEGDFLRCVDNGNLVGYDGFGGGGFYCNNESVVKVEFVKVKT